jgi:TolB-like protein
LAAKALEALAMQARNARDVAGEVELWQRLASMAPDDSRVALELMRALDKAGNRAGALRHARVHASVLRETLGMGPDSAVQALADQFARRSDASVIASIPVAVTTVATAASKSEPASQRATSPALGSTIAVLPFHSVRDADTSSYFADGVSEELTHLLTRTPGLRVASRTSAFAYRDVKLDVREVARRLHVNWILEGSVRHVGNKLRIVAQLTDARNGYQVWSESFDRTSTDVISMQQEIAIAIANQLPMVVGAPAN